MATVTGGKFAAYTAGQQKRATQLGVQPTTVSGLDYLGSLYKPTAADAPLTDHQIQQQAQADVHASVDPVLAQINRGYDNRETTGSSLISKLGATLAERLKSYAPLEQADYTAEKAGLGAATSGLEQYLGRVGSAAGDSVAAELGNAGLPQGAIDAASAASSGLYGGAGRATAASGYSSLADALGNESADMTYFRKMPAIGDLQTGSAANAFLSGLENSRSTDVGQVTAQIPGTAQNVLQQLRQNELTKAGNRDQLASAKAGTMASFLGGTLDNASSERIAGQQSATSATDSAATRAEQKYEHDHPSADASLSATTAQTAAHTAAVANRNSDVQQMKSAVTSMAATLANGSVVDEAVPVAAPAGASGKYVAKGGSSLTGPFTSDPSQAQTKIQKTVQAAQGYQQIFTRAWNEYAPTLMSEYNLGAGQVKDYIDQALAAAGIVAPKKTGKK